jgi:hypothetical protein
MSLTKVSFAMINGNPANVLDYGADPTGSDDSTSAIQAALNANGAIYLPQGIYKITGAINIATQKQITGAGIGKTIFNCTTSAAGLYATSTRVDAIKLNNFTMNGNYVALVGISIGVNAGAASSSIGIDNVTVAEFVNRGIVFTYVQYSSITNFFISNISNGYGLYSDSSAANFISEGLIIACQTGAIFVGSSYSQISNINFFGPYAGAISPDGYLVVTDCSNLFFNGLSFENEITHTVALTRIFRTSSNTTNIFFTNCNWLGTAAYSQNLIECTSTSKIMFSNCTALPPAAGSYILKNNSASVDNTITLVNCIQNNGGYATFGTVFWTENSQVNTAGANVFENRTISSLFNVDYVNSNIYTKTGVIVTTPDLSKKYRIAVDNAGAITSTLV